MKQHTTMKSVKALSNFYNKPIIKARFCEIQDLLNNLEPIYYTCGKYGWNADIYELDNYYICTGYRPFGNLELNPNLLEAISHELNK